MKYLYILVFALLNNVIIAQEINKNEYLYSDYLNDISRQKTILKLLDGNNTDEALTLCEKITCVGFECKDKYYYLALCYKKSGSIKEAKYYYLKAIENGFNPYDILGNVLYNDFDCKKEDVDAAFEEAGSLYGISPSLLYTYAAGEGLILLTGYDIENNVPINSFNLLGLDFFGSEWHKYNLPSYFKSGGNTALGETPNFGTATHTTITQADGSPLIRNEAGGATKISPVYFKNFNIAIIGASGVYAAAYNKSVTSGQNQGWGELNENEKAFFGYYSIQYPNRELSYYGNASGNFLDNSIRYDLTSTDPSDVPSKAYRRWVEWRYVKISGFFSK
ncbi:MAG: hypothetical protein RBR32_12190 [Bacteroidales bacterium]|nr:hypothetical protein [Bacteroidales bacterium]